MINKKKYDGTSLSDCAIWDEFIVSNISTEAQNKISNNLCSLHTHLKILNGAPKRYYLIYHELSINGV